MFGTGGCFFASLAYLAVSAEPHRLWFSLFEEAWKGQRLPVSGCTAQVYVRYRGRAVSGTQPWVCDDDYGERRTHRDRPAVGRGSLHDRFRGAIVGDCQWPDPPTAPLIWRLSEGRFVGAEC